MTVKPEFFVFWIKLKNGPLARNEMKWIEIDATDEGLSSIKEVAHSVVAVALLHFFSHPFPGTLNRVEIRAAPRQRNQVVRAVRNNVVTTYSYDGWDGLSADFAAD